MTVTASVINTGIEAALDNTASHERRLGAVGFVRDPDDKYIVSCGDPVVAEAGWSRVVGFYPAWYTGPATPVAPATIAFLVPRCPYSTWRLDRVIVRMQSSASVAPDGAASIDLRRWRWDDAQAWPNQVTNTSIAAVVQPHVGTTLDVVCAPATPNAPTPPYWGYRVSIASYYKIAAGDTFGMLIVSPLAVFVPPA